MITVAFKIPCLTLSVCACFLEFQKNSTMAATKATANPHKRTTNTPPMLPTPNELALPSLFLSSLAQDTPELFHHLLYNIWITPFSCKSKMARDILSLHGEPWKESKKKRLLRVIKNTVIPHYTFNAQILMNISING